jgi:hypothetical protein
MVQHEQASESTDPIANHALILPVTPDQQRLLTLIMSHISDPANDWPIYDFVARSLRQTGIDAAAELAAFPRITHRTRGGRAYRHVWTDGGGGPLNEASKVQVTIAGFRAEASAGPQFADFLARVIGHMAELESEILPDPIAPASQTYDLADVLEPVQGYKTYRPFLPLVASILAREEPVFGCTSQFGVQGSLTWKVSLRDDLTSFLGTTNATDYVRRVLISMGADRPAVEPEPVDTPLALIDEIGYLDAVWQARIGRPSLFGSARIASCAGLALPCSTSADFDARMNALYDVINRIDVRLDSEDEAELKKQGKSGSLQRLRYRLAKQGLPPEEFDRFDASIGILQDAIRIRAALHSGVEGELPIRYRALGLPFPPGPHSTTWDHIRGRCSTAIRSIRQAIETLP